MEFVTGFTQLLQGIAGTMSSPTFENFLTIVNGWIVAPRRTVTGVIVAAGKNAHKYYSTYHRFFSTAKWSIDAVGLAVFRMIEPYCSDDKTMIAIDDTLARKCGRKIFGCGMHHDPLLSSRGKAIVNWGHSWVVVGVIVQMSFRPGHFFCLPILFRLYLNKKRAATHRRVYRKRTELAVEMLKILCKHRKNKRFHAIADSAYGGQSVLGALPDNCDLTSRLVKDARLYNAPSTPKIVRRGRPRVRGNKLPTPMEMLAGRCRHRAIDIDGRRETVRLSDVCARVHAVPNRPLRVVATESINSGRYQQIFYSTCHTATAEEVIGWYASRWSIEVSFHDSKQSLGFEEPQGWFRRAVERTAPLAMLLYSLIILWFTRDGHRHYRIKKRAWYHSKSTASFADMLFTLRRKNLEQTISSIPLRGAGSQKIRQLLENTIQQTL